MCVCGALDRRASRVSILILRHASERWSTTNTARWVGLSLEGVEIRDYGGVDLPPLTIEEATTAGAWLLYPTQDGAPAPDPKTARPSRLIVPDGRWQHARRLVSRHLAGLPRLALVERPQPLPALRSAERPERRSTLEAIADALEALDDAASAAMLRENFRKILERRPQKA